MYYRGKTLSPKWGLNGTTLVCPICGASVGFSYRGQIDEEDSQAPKYTVSDILCKKCQDILDGGGKFFIEVKNDIRTGRVAVANQEDANKIFEEVRPVNLVSPEEYDYILSKIEKLRK